MVCTAFFSTLTITRTPQDCNPCRRVGNFFLSDPDGETGCRLTLCRTGSSQRMDSKYMAVAPEFGYRVLQYLCENGVQPEIWQDVVAELDAAQQTEQEGGAWRGQ